MIMTVSKLTYQPCNERERERENHTFFLKSKITRNDRVKFYAKNYVQQT